MVSRFEIEAFVIWPRDNPLICGIIRKTTSVIDRAVDVSLLYLAQHQIEKTLRMEEEPKEGKSLFCYHFFYNKIFS